MKYNYTEMGMDDKEIEKFSPHFDKLEEKGVTQDQLNAVLNAVIDSTNIDTVDLGSAKIGKSCEVLLDEYDDFLEHEEFDSEKREKFIDLKISEADDEEKATETFKIYRK